VGHHGRAESARGVWKGISVEYGEAWVCGLRFEETFEAARRLG